MKKLLLILALPLILIGAFLLFMNSGAGGNMSSGDFSDTLSPLVFQHNPIDGQFAFVSIPSQKLKAKLIPNLEQRKKRGISEIPGILGVTHFFLDHDLTTGFVHPYTQNFFNVLPPEGYVMKFDRATAEEGWIYYLKKKDLKSTDTLGRQFAFMRQWKLSDLAMEINKTKITVTTAPCRFHALCGCMQVNNKQNPYNVEFPIGNFSKRKGEYSLAELNEIGTYSGGTIVIIWENEKGETWFRDVHGSVNDMITEALKIRKQYNIDPVIAIGDAGPFAQKVRADENNIVYSKDINAIFPTGSRFGAGFGYVPLKR
ncbi:MAG: hypothetical protein ACKOXB_07845 [Flavobacteriales bacterium]